MSFIDIDKNIKAKSEFDSLLKRYKIVTIPTNGGWTVSNVGSGSVTQAPQYIHAFTGTTASSRALALCYTFGLNSGTIVYSYIDWTRQLEFSFNVARAYSDDEVYARVQLKETTSEGILAQRGIGVNIANYTITGEAYGTERGTVGIGTLTNNGIARIKIVKTKTEVQFWVNDNLEGTLTGTAVPNVVGTAVAFIVVSLINGATGGVNAQLLVGNFWIVQEW